MEAQPKDYSGWSQPSWTWPEVEGLPWPAPSQAAWRTTHFSLSSLLPHGLPIDLTPSVANRLGKDKERLRTSSMASQTGQACVAHASMTEEDTRPSVHSTLGRSYNSQTTCTATRQLPRPCRRQAWLSLVQPNLMSRHTNTSATSMGCAAKDRPTQVSMATEALDKTRGGRGRCPHIQAN